MADNREQEKRVDRLETKFEMYMRAQDERFNSFVQEIRQQNQMRADEIRDLQKRQDEDRCKHDADMKELQKRQEAASAKHEADMKAAQAKHDADMKAAQAKHDADMKELQKKQEAAQAKRDAEFKEFQKKHDADMREMNQKIDGKFDKLSDQIHTMTIAAVVGFGAIAVAIGGLVVFVLKYHWR